MAKQSKSPGRSVTSAASETNLAGNLRRMRLEWFFRLAVEPRRMWRRYILGNPLFLFHVVWHKLSGRARDSVADTSLRTGTS